MRVSQSLNCFEETVGRNTIITGNSGQGSERSKESYKESFCGLKENNDHDEQNVGRNMEDEYVLLFFVVVVQVSDRNEEGEERRFLF